VCECHVQVQITNKIALVKIYPEMDFESAIHKVYQDPEDPSAIYVSVLTERMNYSLHYLLIQLATGGSRSITNY
jgi:hypothetical protein